MAAETPMPVALAQNTEQVPQADSFAEAQVNEAIELLTQALQPHTPQLDSIYLFSLDRSLPSLRKITSEVVATMDGKVPSAVTDVIDWLNQANGASGTKGTKAVGRALPPKLFTQTLELRKKMFAVLRLAGSEIRLEFAERLARWIITNWGGVDRKQQESCKELFAQIQEWRPPEKIGDYAKVARWSKVLAFHRPLEAAIFDARVVYSLNWYLRKAKTARRFPTLPSENSMMNVLDHSALVACERMGWENFSSVVLDDIQRRETGARIKSQIRRLIEGPDDVVPEEDAYAYYLSILPGVARRLFKEDEWGITQTEMMLFGLATTAVAREVCQAMRRSSTP